METYKRKEQLIYAEQFLEGKNVPEGVYQKKIYDYQDPAPYYRWGIDTNVGFIPVFDTNYIVKNHSGDVISVMSEKDFSNEYVKA